MTEATLLCDCRTFVQCHWQSLTSSGDTGVRSVCDAMRRDSSQRSVSWKGLCRSVLLFLSVCCGADDVYCVLSAVPLTACRHV